MNSLSWFLWLAEVANKIYGISWFWGIVFSVAMLAMLALVVITTFILAGDPSVTKEVQPVRSLGLKFLALFTFLAMFCGAIYSVIPSQQTLYTILASEVTEKLSNTKIATDLGADAQEILRGYLKKLKAGLGEEKSR